MSDIVYGLDLEQTCIEPGHWKIEGLHVRRLQSGAWVAFREFGGPVLASGRTLRAVREWIADQ